MTHRIRQAIACSALAVLASAATAQDPTVDPKIAPYQRSSGISGTMKSMGSDTMNNEMALWAEGFRRFYPDVKVEVEGKGSSSAPPALVEGIADFGAMSRPMKAKEVDEFESRFGYKPTAVNTSLDCIAVFVHKDNPVAGLSLQQIDAIYSKSRAGGHPSAIATWGDLGLTGEWQDRPISLYGRNSASGTYGFFKEHALFKGDFRDAVKEQPGSSSVVQAVASDRYGIGYSGIGYATPDVRAVPVAFDAQTEPVPASLEEAYAGNYPLARFLILYVNRKPSQPLDPLPRAFLDYVLSAEGQAEVVKSGYIPLPARVVTMEREALGLSR